jgi:hypothetical protein
MAHVIQPKLKRQLFILAFKTLAFHFPKSGHSQKFLFENQNFIPHATKDMFSAHHNTLVLLRPFAKTRLFRKCVK